MNACLRPRRRLLALAAAVAATSSAACGDPCAVHLEAPGLGGLGDFYPACGDEGGSSASTDTSASDGDSASETGGGVTDGTASSSTTDGDPNDCDIEVGSPLGPCRPDGTCDSGLECIDTGLGTLCRPPCAECEEGKHDACLSLIAAGDDFCDAVGCLPGCGGGDDIPPPDGCGAGTVCDQALGACVWPKAPPPPPDEGQCAPDEEGAWWGPCTDGDACAGGAFCVDLGDAGVCLPACLVECPGGASCSAGVCALDGLCVPPCAADSDCPALGMVCRAYGEGATCAWPLP